MTKQEKIKQLRVLEKRINEDISTAEKLADETRTEFRLDSVGKRYIVKPSMLEQVFTRKDAIEELASSDSLDPVRIKVLREVLANTYELDDRYSASWEESSEYDDYYEYGWHTSSSDC